MFSTLLLEKVSQFRVSIYAGNLIVNYIPHVLLDLVVVRLNVGFHLVLILRGIFEIGQDWNRHIFFHFGIDFFTVHDNLCVKNLLVNALVDVVGNRSDKYSLCQCGNLARWNKRIHLRVE